MTWLVARLLVSVLDAAGQLCGGGGDVGKVEIMPVSLRQRHEAGQQLDCLCFDVGVDCALDMAVVGMYCGHSGILMLFARGGEEGSHIVRG